ncbi:hypothetical protein ACHQM5_023489 [Ranunculus cassubicifolius]
MKQWNLGVYFSLRFQEIVVALDNELMVPSLTINDNPRCSTWLSAGLASRTDNTRSNPSTEWATSASPEDLVYVLHDTNCLITELGGDYLESVVKILSSCPNEILNMIKQSILQGVESLKNIAPQVMQRITTALVDRGVDVSELLTLISIHLHDYTKFTLFIISKTIFQDLRQIKGITATYRMTNKPLPVTHSPYVVGILRPLSNFLGSARGSTYLTKEARHELILSVTEKITHLYDEKVSEIVDLSSLQGIRLSARNVPGARSDVSDNYVSDTDKIRMQLFLDVQTCVEARNFDKFHSLWKCVAPGERQNEISF